MKQETKEYIKNMLEIDVEAKKNLMLQAINFKYPSLETRIGEYQEAFEMQMDFSESMDEEDA